MNDEKNKCTCGKTPHGLACPVGMKLEEEEYNRQQRERRIPRLSSGKVTGYSAKYGPVYRRG